jgi:hypothetical protein
MRELEEVGERLRDEEASGEAGLELSLELVERTRIADRDELRRIVVEPRAEVAHCVDLEMLEVGVPPCLRRHLGDVEMVVDVAVEMEAGGEHGVHRLTRLRQRDRDVKEELTGRRIGDDGSLVADDEIVELRLLEVRPHRPEHPPRDDDDMCAGRSRLRQRVPRPWPQHTVLGDERPVEVEREGGYAPREVLRQLYGYGALPPVESTT